MLKFNFFRLFSHFDRLFIAILISFCTFFLNKWHYCCSLSVFKSWVCFSSFFVCFFIFHNSFAIKTKSANFEARHFLNNFSLIIRIFLSLLFRETFFFLKFIINNNSKYNNNNLL